MGDLAGRRVLITRAAEDCGAWAEALEKLGATAVAFPCIECATIDTHATRAQLARELPSTDWLVFTSKRGVAAFAGLNVTALPANVKVAAVGATTARAARTMLGRVDLVSERGTAADLADALKRAIAASGPAPRLFIAVAKNADDTLERALRPAGAVCTRLDVYRTVPMSEQTPKRAVSSLGADNVFLASPSAVTGFVNQVRLDSKPEVFTIGPSTTAAARAAGLDVTGEAPQPSLKGLLEAMRCAN